MTNLFGFLAPVMTMIAGASPGYNNSQTEYFRHRKNTPLSKQPHIETPKTLTKRQKRRLKGRKS